VRIATILAKWVGGGLNIRHMDPIVSCRITRRHPQHVRIQRRRKELNGGSNEEIIEFLNE
jgi:hypothetical protein